MRATSVITGALVTATILAVGCSRSKSSNGAVTTDSTNPSTAASTGTSAPSGTAAGDSIVRGTVVSVSDSMLTLSSSGGEVHVALAQPVKVYARENADLSRVTDTAFIGVTSVPQPDGTQRATEIHVFPEELRGLGEGSRPMAPAGGAAGGGSRSTMTNGTVAGSRMTNGAARMTNGAARMTNGTSKGAAGGTMTVQYNGGTQTITVPPNVTVTVIAPTSTKLTAGANVIALATKQPDGTLRASRVMLAGNPQPPK